MKCEACLEMMDDLIEGALDDSLAREVTAHIAMCGPCSQLCANLRYEQELYGKYLLDVEPTPALWANLRLEMEKEKTLRASQPQLRLQRWLTIAIGGLRVTPQLATALVLITIGLAIGIMVWRTTIDTSKHQAQNSGVVGVQPSPEVNRAGTDRDSDDTDRQSSTNDNDRTIRTSSNRSGNRRHGIQLSAAGSASRRMVERSSAVPTVEQVARRAEQEYLSAIEILSRDIKGRRAFISPALLLQLERALTEADRKIAATRRVAREQPRDPVAVQYLALAYENKVELLRDATSW
ncbi:MAG TPA: zf-HC2 domain-containing protein [Pyrinomonadaceae bacterium]|nr:zf-HC2 domain-containing protein [Pyrinomonadaceae bacterium]